MHDLRLALFQVAMPTLYQQRGSVRVFTRKLDLDQTSVARTYTENERHKCVKSIKMTWLDCTSWLDFSA